MRVLTTSGLKDLELDSRKTRSIVGSHWNAIQAFLATGDTDPLEPYTTTLIKDSLLLTDPDEIERLAQIGEIDIDHIYEEPS
jgi:hypothetical protein